MVASRQLTPGRLLAGYSWTRPIGARRGIGGHVTLLNFLMTMGTQALGYDEHRPFAEERVGAILGEGWRP